jgi:hypothetical protein
MNENKLLNKEFRVVQTAWLQRAAQMCLETRVESGCESCHYHRDGVYGGCKIGWPYQWEV